jgi:choline-sulfatase
MTRSNKSHPENCNNAQRKFARRGVLAGVAGLAATATGTGLAAAAAGRRKPNLLWLISDDHAGYVLGADGNSWAKTPHIDRFAGESMRFSSAYCCSPMCTPSRASFLTGRLPHSAGVTKLATAMPEGQHTVATQLDAAGYWTGVVGKMHFNRPGRPGLHGFDLVKTEDVVNKEWAEARGPAHAIPGISTRAEWHAFREPVELWMNVDKRPIPRSFAEGRSSWIADEAMRQMTAHRDEPFALWVSFEDPHCPFDFPLDFRDLYRLEDFPVPPIGPEDAGQIPQVFKDLTPRQKQGIIAAYYTSVAYLDQNISRVLAKLDELGLAEDTLVIYSADHGYSLGQHGRFEKHCHYEPAMRVPLMMRWPDKIHRGVTSDMIELVDLPVTILDMLAAPPFPAAHGQTLRPYLTGTPMPKPRRMIFSEYLPNEEACVRTARWKYIHARGKEARTDGYASADPTPGRTLRLYDLEADTGEFQNVADRHPDVVDELSHAMLARFRATHPDSASEPKGLDVLTAVEWYLVSRDAPPPHFSVNGHPL